MNIERTKVETVIVENGYSLSLSKDEAKILVAVLGKINFNDVESYLDGYDVKIDNVTDRIYKMYCDLYDHVPMGG